MFIAQGRWSVEIEEWDYLKNPDISIVVGNMNSASLLPAIINVVKWEKCQVVGGILRKEWNTLGLWYNRVR